MIRTELIKKILPLLLLFIILMIISVSAAAFLLSTDNQGHDRSFFDQFVLSGGPIVWFILLPMSLLTVFIAAESALLLRKKILLPEDIAADLKQILDRQGIESFSKEIQHRPDVLSTSLKKAITAAKKDPFRLRSVLTESLQDKALVYLRKIQWLNLIGNISPMVGLFGTVFGMIKLFNTIVAAGGQPKPAQLADGISIALVTTFWGLFIAIPSLTLHSIFKNKIESIITDALTDSEEIVITIKIILQKRLTQKTRAKQTVKLKNLEHNPGN